MTQEQIDLAEFKRQKSEIMRTAFNAMRDFLRADEVHLKNCGYKTPEQGIVSVYQHSQRLIDAKMKEFLKKYPD